MTQILEGIYAIPGQDEFIPDSHTYVIGQLSSNDLSLVDPGLVGKGSDKIESIQKMGIDLKSIKRIILTHTHLDHIGCLSEIQKTLPRAELWIHRLEAEPLEQGDEKTVYGLDMFRDMVQGQYGLKAGTFRFDVHRKLEGGEDLEIGGMTWQVLHIPGHSMGSIGLYHESGKVLIPGDVIYADYAIGRFDLHGADAAELKKSLMRLSDKEVGTLLPGHHDVMKEVPSGYIRKTAKQWESYLA
jgi:glyoxylase-like metal-dependent hydrolase (beta-lactamase superfamily II)